MSLAFAVSRSACAQVRAGSDVWTAWRACTTSVRQPSFNAHRAMSLEGCLMKGKVHAHVHALQRGHVGCGRALVAAALAAAAPRLRAGAEGPAAARLPASTRPLWSPVKNPSGAGATSVAAIIHCN